MIRYMRHGSPPRLRAPQPIRVPDPGESLSDSISRRPYDAPVDTPELDLEHLFLKRVSSIKSVRDLPRRTRPLWMRNAMPEKRYYRIGQIVPSSNTTMETEIPAMFRARDG